MSMSRHGAEGNLRAGQTFGHRAAQFAGAADDNGHATFQGKQGIEIVLGAHR